MRWIPFAICSALVAAGIYAVGLATPATPPTIQGDTLGIEPGESWSEYEGRAGASISQGSEPSFGLVTFARPLSPSEAAAAVESLQRVNGLLLIDAPLTPTPEPPPGQTRADVFARITDQRIGAVVAYDTPDAFKNVADGTDVAAVEILPPDAVWGSFTVTPWHGDHPATGV